MPWKIEMATVDKGRSMISNPAALDRPKEKVIGIPITRSKQKMIPRTARLNMDSLPFLAR